MRRRPSVVVLLPLLFACAPAVDSATFASHPPRPADADVRVYRSQQPACAFEEVGLVIWRPQNRWDTLDDGVEAMRAQARKMGGDAILDFRYEEAASGLTARTTSDSTRVVTTSSIDHDRVATGTVVRFLETGC